MTKKIALLIYGQVREYQKCYETVYNNILNPLNPDVFMHIWDKRGASLYSKRVNLNTNYEIEDIDISDIQNKFNPKTLIVENYKQWEDSLVDSYKQVWYYIKTSALPRNYKIREVIKLKKEYEIKNNIQYDGIIIFRPDTIMFKTIPDYVLNDLNYFYHNNLMIWYNPLMVHDTFNVCSNHICNIFMNFYDNLPRIWNQYPLMSHEIGMFATAHDTTRTQKIFLDENGIKNKSFKEILFETYRQPQDFNNFSNEKLNQYLKIFEKIENNIVEYSDEYNYVKNWMISNHYKE